MAIWFENCYAKIWKITKKEEKYTNFTMSTSEKDRQHEGKYINSNWLGTAIGHAHNQIANGEIEAGDRVTIAKGKVLIDSYQDKDGEYHNATKVVVTEFSIEGRDEDDAPPKKSKKVPPKKDKVPPKKSKAKPEPEDDDEDDGVISDEEDGELPF